MGLDGNMSSAMIALQIFTTIAFAFRPFFSTFATLHKLATSVASIAALQNPALEATFLRLCFFFSSIGQEFKKLHFMLLGI